MIEGVRDRFSKDRWFLMKEANGISLADVQPDFKTQPRTLRLFPLTKEGR